ncbi:MAG: hypothetical protein AAF899_19100 [Pseudomonadota bacterium]
MHRLSGMLIAAAMGLPAMAQDQVPDMTWQDAVAELAAERTRAETCVSVLKRHAADDAAALSRGELAYSEAKADIDAVIGSLVVVLAEDEDPATFETIERDLRRGVAARKAFCETAIELVPETNGTTRGILTDLLGEAIGALIEAAKDIYLDYREEDRLKRKTIQTQLEATRWRGFADIAS